MLVSEVISLAKNSELRQLAVKDNEEAVLGFLNLGVLELHKRFPLRTEEAILTLRNGKPLYRLDGTDDAVSMYVDSVKNLLVIYKCYDEQGDEVPINDENDPLGIMTPSYNVIQVPSINDGEILSALYQVAPDFYTSVDDVIALPPQLIEALLHYIGYRGHSTISADIKAQNNTHYIRFDQSCERVLDNGLILPDDMESNNFDQRGFV